MAETIVASVRAALAERLGRPIELSGPEDELSASISPMELGPAVDVVGRSGARHVMLLGLDRRGLDPGSGLAIEEIVALTNGPLLRLRVDLPASEPIYPSITPLVPAAQWDEREVRDLFGIVPVDHPDPRRLVIHEPAATPDERYPLLKVRPPAQ